MSKPQLSAGRPLPLGASISPQGVNFSLFSRHATHVYLELYDAPGDARPSHSFALNSVKHRTGDVWHACISGIGPGQLYGYRVDGPYEPEHGHRFNVHKLLADPYARSVVGPLVSDHDATFGYIRGNSDLTFNTEDSAAYVSKCCVVGVDDFDWMGDQFPRVPLADTVIYETHVRGFTAHPSAGTNAPAGTYLALAEKAPYLRDLGITTVELMPVHDFDHRAEVGINPKTNAPLHNVWGYSPLHFSAPHRGYASESTAARQEFRQMVRELHRHGLEVIIDVVYNHTGEGSEIGPTLTFRGIDNACYYMLEAGGRKYLNYSGCGNTINCNHPAVREWVIDSLRHWVVEMHVDGFRFDLATILGRNPTGGWIGEASLLDQIAGDPVLRCSKLIAESWDAGGQYQVGQLADGLAEWNGRFRDDLRRFVRGDQGTVADVARRIGGSPALYRRKTSPAHSINFVTAHDGFTVRDLASYEQKHNVENGEDCRDGTNQNYGRNWGIEGETDDATIIKQRLTHAKSLLALLLCARGTPMLLAGDERWRTQGGNNNAYCQDGPEFWINWHDDAPHSQEMHQFVQRVIAARRDYPALRFDKFADPFASNGNGSVCWHGIAPGQPDWAHHSHSFAAQFVDATGSDCYVAANGWHEPLTFSLPSTEQREWRVLIDTTRPHPHDALSAPETLVDPSVYVVNPYGVVLLVC